MRKPKLPRFLKTTKGRLAALFTATAIGLGTYAALPEDEGPSVPVSQLLNEVSAKNVADVTMKGDYIIAHRRDNGAVFNSRAAKGQDIATKVREIDKNISLRALPESNPFNNYFWGTIFPTVLPFAIIIPTLIGVMFLMQRIQAGGFGFKKKKIFNREVPDVTFDDVAGQDEAKTEVLEVVDFLKDPQKFKDMGSVIPRGLLLVGPPGNGKTLLAKAIAGSAGVPIISISGSDFVEVFVGVGAKRVRQMFEMARKSGPCIIFIDELDAVFKQRSNGPSNGGSDEREQTLNQMLVEMDGFAAQNSDLIVIGATNRPETLDAALMRPGRFSRHVYVELPDIKGREKVLEVHLRLVAKAARNPDLFEKNIDVPQIARRCPGFSGADLANLVNEATFLAARRSKKTVGMQEMLDSFDKVLLGPEMKSRGNNPIDRKTVLYHEAGHALVAYYLSLTGESAAPEKATIIPRMRSLGHVMRMPSENMSTVRMMKGDLAVAAAGRAGEEILHGDWEHVSVGAKGDIDQMTTIARNMVHEYGMIPELGMVSYSAGNSLNKPFSEQTGQKLDDAVRDLTGTAYTRAKQIIIDNEPAWRRLVTALDKYETLEGEEIGKVICGEPIREEIPAVTIVTAPVLNAA